MSFFDCINRSIQAGELNPEKAQEALELFEELMAQEGRFNEATASQKTFDILKFQAFQRKRQRMLQVNVSEVRLQEMNSYVNAHGEKDRAAGYRALVDRDEFAVYDNLESRRKQILGRAHSMFAGGLAKFRRTLLGEPRNKANLRNLTHELFGRDTGDVSARELAESWKETSEMLRKRANAGGMAIPKRKDWGMPQTHDVLKVRETPMQEWVEFVRNKVDPERMMDYSRGFKPDALETDLILREVYETIASKGFSNVEPALHAGKRKLGNQRSDHRFLPFKDSESWLQYHERFGEGDTFSVMMGHIDGMARDIARLEIFGPNDEATMNLLRQTAVKSAVQKDASGIKRKGKLKFSNWEEYTKSVLNQADNMVDAFTGRLNSPVNAKVGRTLAGFRSLHAAAVLGSAAISAITDINYGRIAARVAGLSEAKLLGNVVKNLVGLDNVSRGTVATRLGLIADHWSTVASAQMRYIGEVEGPEITRRMSDFVLRVSGLTPWTQANQWGYGMTFLGELAERSGRGFDKLDPNMQKLMAKYGISKEDWDVIRTTELYDASVDIDGWKSSQGTMFMKPENITKRTDIDPALADQLTNKVLRMVQSETEFAVPTSSLRGRVQIIGNTRPGTVQGEFLRSVAMYKQFALTVMNTHLGRVMAQQGAYAKGAAAADLVISTTLMGGLALQLKELSKGRDARDMSDAKFWSAALLQGGGLGIFGDFLFSDQNRFGVGLAKQLTGPVVEFSDDIIRRAFLGNIFEFAQGEETNFGREMVRLLRRYTPGGSIWYSRLAYERLVLDQLQLWADPRARQNLRRMRRNFKNRTGQRFWWNPGTTQPQRQPVLSGQ